MNPPPIPPPPPPEPAPTAARALRRLFLTLFLRGRTSRGLKREGAPRSVGSKLGLTLFFYGLFGLFALMFLRQPVFALSVYLHGMTFVFLGMFVASSAGEILFNKEEADILLHRPVTPRDLLWAKIGVLVEVSLWLAGAFNLAGLLAGSLGPHGHWSFAFVHLFSTALEALFCTGAVVLAYQLCLRWFGRERLEGLMTLTQIIVSVMAVLASQIMPRVMLRFGDRIQLNTSAWWVSLLPPAWFAGWDDAVAGTQGAGSWLLAGIGLIVTSVVLWLAFGKLAQDYEVGLQKLGQTVSRPRPQGGRRWVDWLTTVPPLRWWLRDPVSRASFLLVAAYLLRDRDVKLRVYPGIAPMLVIPAIMLLQTSGHGSGAADSGFGMAFTTGYLGLVPLLGLSMLRYSQHWQAADMFHVAPLPGPALLFHGARRAVLCFLALPTVLIFGISIWFLCRDWAQLLLLLPGIISLPVYALVPGMGESAVPLSQPTEEAKSTRRGLNMIGAMFVSLAVSGVAVWAWHTGWFWQFLAGETLVVVALYITFRQIINAIRWQSLE